MNFNLQVLVSGTCALMKHIALSTATVASMLHGRAIGLPDTSNYTNIAVYTDRLLYISRVLFRKLDAFSTVHVELKNNSHMQCFPSEW